MNPLDRNIEDVATPIHIDKASGFEPELFFCGDRFWAYAKRTFDTFDIATYSINVGLLCGTVFGRVSRLITGLPPSPFIGVKIKHHKLVLNNHTKIFLCYYKISTLPVCAYVGSQNLTQSTNLNIMYRVRDEHVGPILTFFNQMWKAK